MINHARTLLVHRDGGDPLLEVPGEELIDRDFRELDLSPYLHTVRTVLYGLNPDRYMLNYRVRQFLSVLHASSLVGYIYLLDPRVTYDFTRNDLLTTPPVTATRVSGNTDDALTVVGTGTPPDASGHMHHRFQVELTSTTLAKVTRLTLPVSVMTFPFSMDSGVSSLIPLQSTGGQEFYLHTDNVAQAWDVDLINPPQKGLGQLLTDLDGLAEPILRELFGEESEQPFATFRALWTSQPETPLRLSGFLMMLIYRMELQRRWQRGT